MTNENDQSDQPSVCKGCPQAHACRDVWAAERRGPFNPLGLVLSSALAFLLPWVGAIVAGAGMQHYSAAGSGFSWPVALAGVGGFALGLLVARLLIPKVRRRFPSPSPSTCDRPDEY